MVQRILTEMFRFNLFTSPPTGNPFSTVTSAAHQAVGNDIAEKSATLLKNSSHTLPLSADHAGTVAVIGPAASTQPIYGGGGSAYVNPSQTVTPLAGLQAAAGSGTKIVYQPGPADRQLAGGDPVLGPDSGLQRDGGFGRQLHGDADRPGDGHVRARDHEHVRLLHAASTCRSTAQQLIDNPSTPAGQHVLGGGEPDRGPATRCRSPAAATSSALTWATPSDLAPGIAAAVAAAKSASTAVVVVSDDTESEATDRLSLNLPSAQDELISAVAAANPHTVVVVDAGAPIVMPWFSQVSSVLDAWYPGQSNGTVAGGRAVRQGRPERPPAGDVPDEPVGGPGLDPGAVPRASNGTRSQYSEGIDVGYRWYDAKNLTPLFPFGFGLSYTRFAFSGLRVESAGGRRRPRRPRVRHGHQRREAARARMSPSCTSATRPRPASRRASWSASSASSSTPGQSARVQFTITPRDTWW